MCKYPSSRTPQCNPEACFHRLPGCLGGSRFYSSAAITGLKIRHLLTFFPSPSCLPSPIPVFFPFPSTPHLNPCLKIQVCSQATQTKMSGVLILFLLIWCPYILKPQQFPLNIQIQLFVRDIGKVGEKIKACREILHSCSGITQKCTQL